MQPRDLDCSGDNSICTDRSATWRSAEVNDVEVMRETHLRGDAGCVAFPLGDFLSWVLRDDGNGTLRDEDDVERIRWFPAFLSRTIFGGLWCWSAAHWIRSFCCGRVLCWLNCPHTRNTVRYGTGYGTVERTCVCVRSVHTAHSKGSTYTCEERHPPFYCLPSPITIWNSQPLNDSYSCWYRSSFSRYRMLCWDKSRKEPIKWIRKIVLQPSLMMVTVTLTGLIKNPF